MKFELVSDNELKITSESEEDTFSLGGCIAASVPGGTAVYLNGDLGAGKTQMTRGIGSQLGINRVKSPSFIIVSEHNRGRIPLVHADLYRLTNEEEVAELDLPYYLEQGALLVIEWPERWINRPVDFPSLSVSFKKDESNTSLRVINVTSDKAEYIKNIVTNLKEK